MFNWSPCIKKKTKIATQFAEQIKTISMLGKVKTFQAAAQDNFIKAVAKP